MKKLLSNHITAHDMGEGWRVDIVTTADTYEAWIYKEGYGIKTLMFGSSQPQNRFCDMVQDNFEDYKKSYIDEVIDI